MKIIHAADIHLDSPLIGLERYEGAPVDRIRHATRSALTRLVDLVISEKASLLLIAGDLYDADWRDWSTGLYFVRQMARLREKEIPVAIVRGNHDAASALSRTLALPENVRVMSHEHAETLPFEDLGVAVHGRSYAQAAETENLARQYPAPVGGKVNIGLLHTSLTGRDGHDPYAPCTVEDLANRGYDYWALGHAHQFEIVSETPHIVFSGALQGRHVKESGPKGAVVIDVSDGRVRSVDFRALDGVRWVEGVVEGEASPHMDDLLDRVREVLRDALAFAEGRLAAIRLTFTGRCELHFDLVSDPEGLAQQVRSVALDVGPDHLWIEKVVLRTEPPRQAAGASRFTGALADLRRSIDALSGDGDALAELAREFEDLKRKLPGAVFTDRGPPDPTDPEVIKQALDDAQALLNARLRNPEAS